MSLPPTLFAYLGPETFIPLASIVAAIVGGMLAFGNHLRRIFVGLFKRAGQLFSKK